MSTQKPPRSSQAISPKTAPTHLPSTQKPPLQSQLSSTVDQFASQATQKPSHYAQKPYLSTGWGLDL